MRIGLVIYGDIEQRTGGNIYDRELLRSLAAFGATWTLLNLRDPRSPHGVGESVAEILARINSEDFDVLLQDKLCHPALNEINAALGSSRRPLRVAIVHNLGYKAAGGEAGDRCKRSEREFLGGVHGCVANSQFTLREVEALLGASPPSVVAYPSVAPDLLLARWEEAVDEIGGRAHSAAVGRESLRGQRGPSFARGARRPSQRSLDARTWSAARLVMSGT